MSFRQNLTLIFPALFVASCSIFAGEQGTPTLSSDAVLQTARAVANATRSAKTSTPTAAPTDPSSPTPLATLEPTETTTPSGIAITADYNANVRNGPGDEYEIIDFILAGQTAEVVGRYDDTPIGTWWFIRRIGQGIDGWVWSGVGTLSGNESLIPFLVPPPTSTPVPLPTNTPGPTDTPIVATATP
jgi:SH3-like domain-containing protein